MLMRTDPLRDFDRLTQQVLGTAARPAVMPIDAWREGEDFVVEFDLPGIKEESLDLDVERNVVTVRAERPDIDPGREMLAAERPRGVFSRQLFLGTTSTPTESRRPTRKACCNCASRSPRRPSLARSPSSDATVNRSSTPDSTARPGLW
jgi:hypothetical protein